MLSEQKKNPKARLIIFNSNKKRKETFTSLEYYKAASKSVTANPSPMLSSSARRNILMRALCSNTVLGPTS